MSSPRNGSPLWDDGLIEYYRKKPLGRRLLILLVWLAVCSGLLMTLVRAIQAACLRYRWRRGALVSAGYRPGDNPEVAPTRSELQRHFR